MYTWGCCSLCKHRSAVGNQTARQPTDQTAHWALRGWAVGRQWMALRALSRALLGKRIQQVGQGALDPAFIRLLHSKFSFFALAFLFVHSLGWTCRCKGPMHMAPFDISIRSRLQDVEALQNVLLHQKKKKNVLARKRRNSLKNPKAQAPAYLGTVRWLRTSRQVHFHRYLGRAPCRLLHPAECAHHEATRPFLPLVRSIPCT